MRFYGGLLEPRGLKLAPLKSTFNAEHFICRLSWSIFSDFGAIHSSNECRSLKSQKLPKTLYFGIQDRSRSSMSVPQESSSAVLVMVSSNSVSICNRSHARRVNSGKITIPSRIPVWCPRSRGISSPSGTKFGHNRLETPRYYTVKTRSLYLTWA